MRTANKGAPFKTVRQNNFRRSLERHCHVQNCIHWSISLFCLCSGSGLENYHLESYLKEVEQCRELTAANELRPNHH